MTLLLRARAWLRARLIADWHRAWRFASVQLAAAGALIEALLQWAPGTLTAAWNAVPADMRTLLPTPILHALPVLLFLAVIVGRVSTKGAAGER